MDAHFGKCPQAKWRIVAFQPDRKNRDELSRVYVVFPNVSTDSREISDKEDDGRPFYDNRASSGISGMLASDQSHQPAGTISMTTLGHVINEYNLEEINFLKIDTEGLDVLVLRGLPDMIAPEVIICEFEDRKSEALGYDYSDLARELEKCRYTYHYVGMVSDRKIWADPSLATSNKAAGQDSG